MGRRRLTNPITRYDIKSAKPQACNESLRLLWILVSNKVLRMRNDECLTFLFCEVESVLSTADTDYLENRGIVACRTTAAAGSKATCSANSLSELLTHLKICTSRSYDHDYFYATTHLASFTLDFENFEDPYGDSY